MSFIRKSFWTLSLIGFFACSAIAQTNQTATQFYDWGKKKTTPQSGYIILKSGTKIDGRISLKGSPGHVDEVTIIMDSGEEKTLPANSLDAYGLYVIEAVCDTPPELFKWGLTSTSTNSKGVSTTKRKTKMQPGYLHNAKGDKLVGNIQLKEVNGAIKTFVFEDAAGKQELSLGEVGHYGLMLTMSDMGKKNGNEYSDEARNFHPGWVETFDGGRFEGFVALVGNAALNNKRYQGINFARSESAFIEYFGPDQIKRAEQDVNGAQTEYQGYDGGVISTQEFLASNANANDETKTFQKGHVVLLNGNKLTGDIKQNKSLGVWFASSITYVDDAKEISNFGPADIDYFTQNIEGEERKFIVSQGVIVELINEGDAFWMYRNPFPTTSYTFLSDLAGAATSAMVDTLTKAAAVRSVEKAVEGENDNLQEDLENLSEAHAAGQELASAIDFKRKEFIVWNRNRDEKTIFNKKNYDDKINELLMGCEKFIFMSKDEQKPYFKFDNVEMAFEFLNECY